MHQIALTPLARALAACVAGLLLAASVAQAQTFGQAPGLERVGEYSSIDWTAMRISAQGFGSAPEGADPSRTEAMAARAAVLDARRNLLEAVGSVRIDSTTTVRDFMTASDEVFTKVSGVIQGAAVDDVARQEDGTFTAKVSMPMTGDLMSQLMAGQGREEKPAKAGPDVAALEQRMRGMEAELDRLRQQNAAQRRNWRPTARPRPRWWNCSSAWTSTPSCWPIWRTGPARRS